MKCSNANYELFYLNLIEKQLNFSEFRIAGAVLIDKVNFPVSLSIISKRTCIAASNVSKSLKKLVEKRVFVRVKSVGASGTIYNIHSDMLKPRQVAIEVVKGSYQFLDEDVISEEEKSYQLGTINNGVKYPTPTLVTPRKDGWDMTPEQEADFIMKESEYFINQAKRK